MFLVERSVTTPGAPVGFGLYFESPDEVAEYLTDNSSYELDRAFCDNLDTMINDIVILGMSYTPSFVLKSVDEIAYDCEFNNYVDSEQRHIVYELYHLEDGGRFSYYSFLVTCVEEGER